MSTAPNTTQRAPDGWESPRFGAGCWLEAGSGKVALSRPAHPRVTQTVRRLSQKVGYENPYFYARFTW
jgi:hypothetical protein